MASLQKNIGSQHITFAMVTTAGAADTGASVSVFVTKDNGSQASGSGTVTNKGNGQYDYEPTQGETNAVDVGFLFTASGDVPVNLDFHTDVVDANGFPKVDLEDIAGSAVSSTTPQLGVNVVNWRGNAVPATNVNGVPLVDLKYIFGTILAESAGGRLAAAFNKLFDVATPVLTSASVNQTGDSFTRLAAPAGASVSADIAAVKSEVDTILNDVNVGAGAIYARLGAPAGASIAADIASVSSLVSAIKTVTDQIRFTIANKIDASIQAAGDFAQAAADKVWGTASRTLTAFGFSVTVGTNNDKTNYALDSSYNAAQNAASPADVLTQAGNALTAVQAEITAVPAANAGVVAMLKLLFQKLRNAETSTASAATISKDDGTVIGTANTSDDNTTFTKSKYS